MTLVTVAVNPDFIVQVSDRRLTGSAGPLTEDETKAIYIATPSAQFLMGYTGLASVGKMGTNFTLMDLLQSALSEADLDMELTTELLAAKLSERWQKWDIKRVGKTNARLSLILTGYEFEDLKDGQRSYAIKQRMVSNFQDWGVGDYPEAQDNFWVYDHQFGGVTLQRIGAYDALDMPTIERELWPLLEPGKPPEAIRDKLLHMLLGQSQDFPTVGKRANAIILRPGYDPVSSYHSPEGTVSLYSHDSVVASSKDDILMFGKPEIRADSPEAPRFVNPVSKRALCPCGSGLQYRRCCGKPLRGRHLQKK